MSLILFFIACNSQEALQEGQAQWSLDKGQRQPIALLSDITEGDLVISEIMLDPDAVADWRGEWIEIYNAHTEAVDINGLNVVSGGETGFTVDAELIIEAGEYAVLANYQLSSLNGGNTEVDFQYNYSNFKLLGIDSVQLSYNGTTFDTVSYDSTYPLEAGRSLITKDLDTTNNDSADGWCYSFSTYGSGDAGTPGAQNDGCIDGNELVEGDLVITEIMLDPASVPDWKGEWFEIQNTSISLINLKDLSFGGGSYSYTGSFSVTGDYFKVTDSRFRYQRSSSGSGRA